MFPSETFLDKHVALLMLAYNMQHEWWLPGGGGYSLYSDDRDDRRIF